MAEQNPSRAYSTVDREGRLVLFWLDEHGKAQGIRRHVDEVAAAVGVDDA